MAEQRARGEHQPPTAAVVLDDRALALQQLLQEVLATFEPTPGAVFDMPQVQVKPQDIVEVCRLAKEDPRLDFKMLLCLAAVDYQEHLQVVYILLSLDKNQRVCIKADLPYDDPRLPTVSSLWRGADWYEREAHDLFGVVFEGHQNLEPLLLYEGFEGYPGRKEFPFHDYQEF